LTEEMKDEPRLKPVPTYEKWLDESAEALFQHPGFAIAKGAIAFVKYLWTREQLVINALLQKGIIQQHEVEELFGERAHEEAQKEGIKQLTRYLLRSASRGELASPRGKKIDPDTVLVLLNDILDINDTGWGGRTFEAVMELAGEPGTLREMYEKEVDTIKKINESKELLRKAREGVEKRKEARVRAERELREYRLKIYLSMCNVQDKPTPSEEERQAMLNGEQPIPND
jgi:hypothetical protein